MHVDHHHGGLCRHTKDAWDNRIIICQCMIFHQAHEANQWGAVSDISKDIFQIPEQFDTAADLFGEDEVVGSIISITAPGEELRTMHVCNESILAVCNDSNPHWAFYVVHFCCWKLTRCQQQSSLLQLLKLARQTKPLISVTDQHHFVPFINKKYFSFNTKLGHLLYAVGQYLPFALQQLLASHNENTCSFIAPVCILNCA